MFSNVSNVTRLHLFGIRPDADVCRVTNVMTIVENMITV